MQIEYKKYATHIFREISFVYQNKHLFFFYAAHGGRELNVHSPRSRIRMFFGKSMYMPMSRRTKL